MLNVEAKGSMQASGAKSQMLAVLLLKAEKEQEGGQRELRLNPARTEAKLFWVTHTQPIYNFSTIQITNDIRINSMCLNDLLFLSLSCKEFSNSLPTDNLTFNCFYTLPCTLPLTTTLSSVVVYKVKFLHFLSNYISLHLILAIHRI